MPYRPDGSCEICGAKVVSRGRRLVQECDRAKHEAHHRAQGGEDVDTILDQMQRNGPPKIVRDLDIPWTHK